MSHPQPSAPPAYRDFAASSFAVARFEDPRQLADLRAGLLACYKPVNSQELFALERMALAQQMILRGARLEAGLFSPPSTQAGACEDPAVPHRDHDALGSEPSHPGNGPALCEAFLDAAESQSLVLLLRYQAQAERLYRRALEEFVRLKRLRSEMPHDLAVAPTPDPARQEPVCRESIAFAASAGATCSPHSALPESIDSAPSQPPSLPASPLSNSGTKSQSLPALRAESAAALQPASHGILHATSPAHPVDRSLSGQTSASEPAFQAQPERR